MKSKILLLYLIFLSHDLLDCSARKIQGAVILTDKIIAGTINKAKKLSKEFILSGNDTYEKRAEIRVQNGKKLVEVLPFPVEEWWSVYGGPCPRKFRPPSKDDKYLNLGNDRGVLLAHLQIWDNYVFEERHYHNDTSSPNDILVIFEDDAIPGVLNITWSLENEFADMNTDFIYLGWCHGDKAGRIPMCAHAYAVTRAGVKKMYPELDSCGLAIDAQFMELFRTGKATFRKAKQESYVPSIRPGTHVAGGIFKQDSNLASFNYHWWFNPTK